MRFDYVGAGHDVVIVESSSEAFLGVRGRVVEQLHALDHGEVDGLVVVGAVDDARLIKWPINAKPGLIRVLD